MKRTVDVVPMEILFNTFEVPIPRKDPDKNTKKTKWKEKKGYRE